MMHITGQCLDWLCGGEKPSPDNNHELTDLLPCGVRWGPGEQAINISHCVGDSEYSWIKNDRTTTAKFIPVNCPGCIKVMKQRGL